jgi:hypothetical protein
MFCLLLNYLILLIILTSFEGLTWFCWYFVFLDFFINLFYNFILLRFDFWGLTLIAIFEYCIFTLQKNQFARGKVYVTNLVRKTIVNTRIVCWFFRANIVLYLFFLKQESNIILYLSLFFSFLFFYKNHYSLLLLSFNSVNQKEDTHTHVHDEETYLWKWLWWHRFQTDNNDG